MRVLHARPRLTPTSSRMRMASAGLVLASTFVAASAAAVTVVERDAAAGVPGAGSAPRAVGASADGGWEVRSGGYSYRADARRDPFMDLRTHASRPINVHDPRAFLVQEIALRGVVKTQTGWTAMILGPDGRTYFVSAGQRLYDGEVTSIDASGLMVRQDVRDAMAPAPVRELRVPLHPAGD